MELYRDTAYQLSELLTKRYSTSFSMSSRLFSARIRRHIYAIYGLVRIADEIVDTYQGDDQLALLDALEQETCRAIHQGHSANPIVHAFALTAQSYDIPNVLIEPFFASMRIDARGDYQPADYTRYIHGSAEVIGLMCLRVFCENNKQQYKQLAPGAASLGAAYQKVNFLRDIASDHEQLGRMYFPDTTFAAFDDIAKRAIEQDIREDFARARTAIEQLPANARIAVATSYHYYEALLAQIESTPANELKRRRVRINNARKLRLLLVSIATGGRV